MKIAVFGTSGHARETVDICDAVGCVDMVLIDRWTGTEPISGLPVIAEGDVPRLTADGYVFAIGIGDNRERRKVRDRFPSLPYANLIHPSVTFGGKQREAFAERTGNIIAAGVRFGSNITPGNFGCFNLNCTVNHDTEIGDFVNLCPGVHIAGNVRLGEGAFIGIGASVVNGAGLDEKLEIGAYAIVGAGAAVIHNVPAGATVAGVPAAVLKKRRGDPRPELGKDDPRA